MPNPQTRSTKPSTQKNGSSDCSSDRGDLHEAKRRMFRLALEEDFGKTLEERGITKGAHIRLFIAAEGKVAEVGTAKLSSAGGDTHIVQRTLHLHELPQSANEDITVITGTFIKPEMVAHPYPYTYKGGEGPPNTLKDMYSAGMYAWDTRMMVHVRVSESRRKKPASDMDDVVLSPPKKRRKGLRNSGTNEPEGDTLRGVDIGKDVNVTDERNMEGNVEVAERTVAEVVDDVILISEQNIDDRGHDIPIRSYELTAYWKVEVNVRLSQLLKPRCTLRDIQKDHVEDLKAKLEKYGYDYGSGLMTVTVRYADNPQLRDLKLSTLVEESKHVDSDGTETELSCLHQSLKAVVVDGFHCREAIAILKNEDEEDNLHKWVHEPLRMILITRNDGEDISSTELLHLGSQRNQVASTVRPFHTLEDHIFAVVSYLKSFADEGKITTQQVRPSNLAAEMYNSSLLPNLEKETYRRYARIGKWFAKYPRAFEKLKSFEPDSRPKIGLLHLDHKLFFQVDEEGVLLLLDSVESYIRNPNTSGTFKAASFYMIAKGLYEICRNAYTSYGAPKGFSFAQFLQNELRHTKTKTITIREHFVRQMRLFSANTKPEEERNLDRNARFESKLKTHFQPDPPLQKSSNASAEMDIEATSEAVRPSSREVGATATVSEAVLKQLAPVQVLECVPPEFQTGTAEDAAARNVINVPGAPIAISAAGAPETGEPIDGGEDQPEESETAASRINREEGVKVAILPRKSRAGGVKVAFSKDQDVQLRRSHRLREKPVHFVTSPTARNEKETTSASVPKKAALEDMAIRKKVSKFKIGEDSEGKGSDDSRPIIPPREESLEQFNEQFDDAIPPVLPSGYEEVLSYVGDLEPSWQEALGLPPCFVDRVLENVHKNEGSVHHTPWLRALHIPRDHRAHLFANREMLEFFQRLAWCKAAKMELDRIHEEARGFTSFLPENNWTSAFASEMVKGCHISWYSACNFKNAAFAYWMASGIPLLYMKSSTAYSNRLRTYRIKV